MANFNLNQFWAGPGFEQPLSPVGAQNTPLWEDTSYGRYRVREDRDIDFHRKKLTPSFPDFTKFSIDKDRW